LIDLSFDSDAQMQCLTVRRGPRRQKGRVAPEATVSGNMGLRGRAGGPSLGNDPSAGSPTETLLRLLLPLNDQV
jgi:hypothetical protein